MHENILSGHYNDPFEFDVFQEGNLEHYEENIKTLLTEKRKRKGYATHEENDIDDRYEDPSKRPGFRRVNLNAPWTDDQSLYWPDYEAEAFEKALEDFKQPANDGYDCKALLDRIKDRWGNEYLKKTLAKQKPIKKESARVRFMKKLNESQKKDELEEECVSGEFQRLAPANVIGMSVQCSDKKALGKKDKYNKLGSIKESKKLNESVLDLLDKVAANDLITTTQYQIFEDVYSEGGLDSSDLQALKDAEAIGALEDAAEIIASYSEL